MKTLKNLLIKLIDFIDFLSGLISKIVSNISNTRLGNFAKEFLGIGTDYPTYLYCPETKQWVVTYEERRNPFFSVEVSGALSEDFKFAFNFQGISYLKKIRLLKNVNRAYGKDFVWKHIISF